MMLTVDNPLSVFWFPKSINHQYRYSNTQIRSVCFVGGPWDGCDRYEGNTKSEVICDFMFLVRGVFASTSQAGHAFC